MKNIKLMFMGFAVALGVGTALLVTPVSAINVFEQCGSNADNSICKAKNDDNASSMIQVVINLLLYVLGIIAVIMIIVGGVRYTTSSGDSASLKTARDTILYSIVGLVVAILAYAIINLVVGRFIKG